MRRVGGTAAYLALLLATHVAVFHVLSPGAREDVLRAISTNLADMGWTAPFRLVGSALVADTSGTVLDNVLIIGLGVTVCLGYLEYRLGLLRAASVFAITHVAVTLIVLAVVAVAVSTGRYPGEVEHDLDYGVSFGALGAIGAVTTFLPKPLRVPWALIAVLFPLTAADWYGLLPDYSTVGHCLSAAIGVVLSFTLVRRRTSPTPTE
ncbi:rhomboid-like protein [Spirillospora sp. NPDC029432]|uniref:rhomboid-like protein n=1 Tax=Spirillospora sp. NPDC029432 TaxID=3154599 RepID=UPI003453126E